MSPRFLCLTGLVLLLSASASAQPAPSADRVVRVSGLAPGSAGQPTTVRFAIYDAITGGQLLWQETQTIAVDPAGQYTAYLGAMSTDGLPLAVFAGGAPRWLAVDGPSGPLGARTLLAAVPYAVSAATAANATTLAGRPATDFQLTPAARRRDASEATGAASAAIAQAPLVVNGSINFLSKFTSAIDLGNSQLYDNGTNIGVGTTSPLDKLHVQFTNTVGSVTGYAVQNLGSTATSYSGMLFYDHTGALRQFQGYNNGTGEYRINNISPTGSINFMIGSESKFRVTTNGNVALGGGANTPVSKLHLYGINASDVTVHGSRHEGSTASPTAISAGSSLLALEGAGHNGAAFTPARAAIRMFTTENWSAGASGTEMRFYTTPNGSTSTRLSMVIQGDGKVGLGGTPTVPLQVFDTQSGITETTVAFFNPTSTGITNVSSNTFSTVSIKAAGQVLGSAFAAVSDARVKTVDGLSDGATDLETLRGLQVTDYHYKDAVSRGARPHKKVIAQQVEQVYPQAVSITTDVVPDIYRAADLQNGWIMLATDLAVGDRVRVITETGHQAVHQVTAVEPRRFRTDVAGDGARVFVYGREVQDFRVVDYEAIAMLNVSATQELARRLEQQTTENDALKAQNAALESRLAAVEAALKTLAVTAQQQR